MERSFIDAVRPDGSFNVGAYDPVARALKCLRVSQTTVRGELHACVGVWFSENARVDPADNGKSAYGVTWGGHSYPHFLAFKGACGALASAHVPFRVVTALNQEALSDLAVVVVPDAVRMSCGEVDVLLEYARTGGHLYISGQSGRLITELTEGDVWELDASLSAVRPRDPALPPSDGADPADGVTSFYNAPPKYVRPVHPLLAAANAPADGVRVDGSTPTLAHLDRDELEILAVLDAPLDDRPQGVFEPRRWVSVHSDPPMRFDIGPAVVRRPWGSGTLTHSSIPFEACSRSSHERLFVALMDLLLPKERVLRITAERSVWAFSRVDNGSDTIRVTFVDTDDQSTAPGVASRIVLTGAWESSVSSVAGNCGSDSVVCDIDQATGDTSVEVRASGRLLEITFVPKTRGGEQP